MVDPFREAIEGIKQTAEGLVIANEGIKRTADAMLNARDEHADLRETVERLERLVMDLVKRIPPPQ